MAKNVTSNDPRKPAIVAALKRISGGTKVTLLKEVDVAREGSGEVVTAFSAHVLGPNTERSSHNPGPFKSLGYFTITAKEAGLSRWVIEWYVPSTKHTGTVRTEVVPTRDDALKLIRAKAPGGRIRKHHEHAGTERITDDDGKNIAWLSPELK
jgi:hypothetical protein